jgi:hypothetical protein
MNHIIHNISIIFIFFGIILLTYNLSKSYNKCNNIHEKSVINQNNINQNNINQDRPSKIFNRMFDSPDIWMGYADFDTKNFKSKLI